MERLGGEWDPGGREALAGAWTAGRALQAREGEGAAEEEEEEKEEMGNCLEDSDSIRCSVLRNMTLSAPRATSAGRMSMMLSCLRRSLLGPPSHLPTRRSRCWTRQANYWNS